ncbi:hypothetical protein LV779_39325 [Streptomyces thinghirensis]|nr:hypothetical protein [Streptomyces thinghirensis]
MNTYVLSATSTASANPTLGCSAAAACAALGGRTGADADGRNAQPAGGRRWRQPWGAGCTSWTISR